MQVTSGSLFYLKNASNQYVIAAENGRYNWPQLGNRNKAVKLKLVRQSVQGNREFWKIVSTEPSLDKKNVLGAFTDSRDCYYWTDNYDKDKQGWELVKPGGGAISFGDQVFIRNVSYQQFLVADSKYPGYITTDETKRQGWSLESVTAVQAAPTPVSQSDSSNSSETEKVFPLSVASGDPTANSVILWTCLNDNKGRLTYELSKTADFQTLVKTESVPASEFGPERDHTVNVDVTDLDANAVYFYRFNYNGVSSKTGRCRTLPSPEAGIAEVADGKGLRLAVITCNDYSTGYFNAFYKLADADVHFVVHLGDFAYEYSQYPDGYGDRHRSEIPFEKNRFTRVRDKQYEGCDRAFSLRDFRKVYRTYREDKALQAAMEQHTWMITLDDHEIADDFYWDYRLNCPGAHPDHPIYKTIGYDFKKDQITAAERKKLAPAERDDLERREDLVREAMTELCQNGKQAWREYVPYRPIARATRPGKENINYQLYRQFKFGKLADFFLTDSRSYRDRPEREVNEEIHEILHDALEDNPQASFETILADEREKRGLKEWQMSMLGAAQKKWLVDGITSSDSKWKVWGNQTLMSCAWQNVAKGMYDDWLGFLNERYEILNTIKKSEQKDGDKSSHFVVLTGDMHTSLIAYLDPDLAGLKRDMLRYDHTRAAGVEFMTPAVTSPGLTEGVYAAVAGVADSYVPGLTSTASGVSTVAKGVAKLWNGMGGGQIENPLSGAGLTGKVIKNTNQHISHMNSEINGYAIATFTDKEMTWDVYSVDKVACEDVNGSSVSTKGVEAEPVVSATYDPNKIRLTVKDQEP